MLLTSAIWGFAFVAQREGMEHVGPFLFNGIRFALGALSLLPLIAIQSLPAQRRGGRPEDAKPWTLILAGIAAGTALFAGASLQQVGLVYTGAGKAGFITGFYVVLVPVFGMFLGHKTGMATWVGALLAIVGLYFLSIQGDSAGINPGDALVALSSVFWTLHVLLIDRFSKMVSPIALSAVQFAWTSLLSLAVALLWEPLVWADVAAAALPILYGGLCSVGVAYTLQVVAQKEAPPAHAAILLSLEGVFAGLGGVWLLKEPLTGRILTGCLFMFAGMLATQWEVLRPFKVGRRGSAV